MIRLISVEKQHEVDARVDVRKRIVDLYERCNLSDQLRHHKTIDKDLEKMYERYTKLRDEFRREQNQSVRAKVYVISNSFEIDSNEDKTKIDDSGSTDNSVVPYMDCSDKSASESESNDESDDDMDSRFELLTPKKKNKKCINIQTREFCDLLHGLGVSSVAAASILDHFCKVAKLDRSDYRYSVRSLNENRLKYAKEAESVMIANFDMPKTIIHFDGKRCAGKNGEWVEHLVKYSISQGMPANDLSDSALWWCGPERLAQSQEFWPNNIVKLNPNSVECETELKPVTQRSLIIVETCDYSQAVQCTLERYRSTGKFKSEPKSGRPRKTTKIEDDAVIIMSKRNRRLTAPEITADLNSRREDPVSEVPQNDDYKKLVYLAEQPQTASATKRRTGVPRPVRSPENIEAVRASMLRSPRRSARKHASALRLSDRSVRRILRDDLHFHPYKMAIVQELSERKKQNRSFQEKWITDPETGFPFFAYSKTEDGVYCKPCCLFFHEGVGKGGHEDPGKLVTSSFRDWKKARNLNDCDFDLPIEAILNLNTIYIINEIIKFITISEDNYSFPPLDATLNHEAPSTSIIVQEVEHENNQMVMLITNVEALPSMIVNQMEDGNNPQAGKRQRGRPAAQFCVKNPPTFDNLGTPPSGRGTDNTPSGVHSTSDRSGLPATAKEPTDAAYFTRRRPEATYDAVAPASAPTVTPAHAAAASTTQSAGTVTAASDAETHEPPAAPAVMEPPPAKVSFTVIADVHRAHDDDAPAPTRAAVQPRRLPPSRARNIREPAAAAALDAISEVHQPEGPAASPPSAATPRSRQPATRPPPVLRPATAHIEGRLPTRQPPEPPPQLPRISAFLDGKPVDILVDTGATDNFVRAATSAAPVRRSAALHLRTAVATQGPVLDGTQILPLQLGPLNQKAEFYTTPGLRETAILGYKFLEEQRAVIDTSRRCIHLGDKQRTTVYYDIAGHDRQQDAPLPLAPDQVRHEFPAALHAGLRKLLADFRGVFNESPRPSTTTIQHTIRLKQETPFRQRPYRYSDAKKAVINQQVEEMLAAGVIEPSASEYASPIVIVKKKSGQHRFCVDYRRLNLITQDEAAPLPVIHDTIKDLKQAQVFSTLDLRVGILAGPDGRLQQKVHRLSDTRRRPVSIPGHAFRTQGGTGHFPTPDGTGSVNRLPPRVRYGVPRRRRRLLVKPRGAPATSSPRVRAAADAWTPVPAQEVSPRAVHLAQIRDAKPPTNRKELRAFLGVCGWLREYVAGFAELATPLTDLLVDKKKWSWSEAAAAAFDAVKDALANPLPLHRPDPSLTYVLQTDASGIGMAAVLYQRSDADDARRVISYTSAKFRPNERRYHSNEQEFLSVIWATRKFRPYLEDKPFILRTDNKSLTWLNTMKDTNAKLTRWSLELQRYQFTIQHCPGVENQLPDLLSRITAATRPDADDASDTDELVPPDQPTMPPPATAPVIAANPAAAVSLADEVKDAQRRDDAFTQPTIQMLQDLQANPPQHGWQRAFVKNYATDDGLLFFGPERKLYVPAEVRPRVLYSHHDAVLAGHPGADETIRSIAALFHWPTLARETRQYIQSCLLCAQYKRRPHQPAAPLRPRQPQQPFEVLACDLLGPYPVTAAGHRNIFVVTDVFTRWVEAFPLTTTSAADCIRCLEQEVFPRWGYPRAIISDNGPQFIGRAWDRACRRWGAQPWFTAVYTPSENPTERRNQELKKTLSIQLTNRPQNEWDIHLKDALFNIRRRRNAATGASPGRLLFGRDLPFPGDWDAVEPRPPIPAEERHSNARRRQREYLQARQPPPGAPPPPRFTRGARVLIKVPIHLKSRYPLGQKWTGLYRVLRRLGETDVYLIDAGDRIVKHHVDRLHPAPPRRPAPAPARPASPPADNNTGTAPRVQ
ncbi:hypothetical protein ILUMI_12684 [Ignelater luminosus]|uniref:RNA-directed DNA polymerase n=1 Tax=Ignelater luminosus TaxID=2038154 RepID=A0A8K0GBJ7_IGNLU|nr:hypothetical protein ILUMI_12684 [Ignelater luminosus]